MQTHNENVNVAARRIESTKYARSMQIAAHQLLAKDVLDAYRKSPEVLLDFEWKIQSLWGDCHDTSSHVRFRGRWVRRDVNNLMATEDVDSALKAQMVPIRISFAFHCANPRSPGIG